MIVLILNLHIYLHFEAADYLSARAATAAVYLSARAATASVYLPARAATAADPSTIPLNAPKNPRIAGPRSSLGLILQIIVI